MVFIIIVFFFIPLLVLVLLYIKIARNLVPTVEGDEQVRTLNPRSFQYLHQGLTCHFRSWRKVPMFCDLASKLSPCWPPLWSSFSPAWCLSRFLSFGSLPCKSTWHKWLAWKPIICCYTFAASCFTLIRPLTLFSTTSCRPNSERASGQFSTVWSGLWHRSVCDSQAMAQPRLTRAGSVEKPQSVHPCKWWLLADKWYPHLPWLRDVQKFQHRLLWKLMRSGKKRAKKRLRAKSSSVRRFLNIAATKRTSFSSKNERFLWFQPPTLKQQIYDWNTKLFRI